VIQPAPPAGRPPIHGWRRLLVYAVAFAPFYAADEFLDDRFSLSLVPSTLVFLVLVGVATSIAERVTRTGSHRPRLGLPYVGDVSPGWSVRLDDAGAARARIVSELVKRCDATFESANRCTREPGAIVAERMGEPEARELVTALQAAGATAALVAGGSDDEPSTT